MQENGEDEVEAGCAAFGVGITLIEPFGEIKRAKERRDWFAGLATSVSYFEYFATNALKSYFKFHGIGLDQKTGELKKDFSKLVEKLGARRLVNLLHGFDLLNDEDYRQIIGIIIERNNLVHQHRKGAGYRYRCEEGFGKLLDQAISCLEVLQMIRPDQKKTANL
jgi:hypothetical protein